MLRSVIGLIVATALSIGADGLARAADVTFAVDPETQVQPGLNAKWRAVQRQIAEDGKRLAECRVASEYCTDSEQRLEAIVASGRSREGRARIGEINRAVNLAIRPLSDLRRFGIADRWSAPLETIGAGGGDCEDYAILKLMALHEAGFAQDDLQLVIVHDHVTRTDHAVAAVRLSGSWLVLDNRGFALVELEQMRYRVLVRLAPETELPHYAGLGVPKADDLLDVM